VPQSLGGCLHRHGLQRGPGGQEGSKREDEPGPLPQELLQFRATGLNPGAAFLLAAAHLLNFRFAIRLRNQGDPIVVSRLRSQSAQRRLHRSPLRHRPVQGRSLGWAAGDPVAALAIDRGLAKAAVIIPPGIQPPHQVRSAAGGAVLVKMAPDANNARGDPNRHPGASRLLSSQRRSCSTIQPPVRALGPRLVVQPRP